MPRIALTKGRLLDPSLKWLEGHGFAVPDLESRALSLPLGRGWEAVFLKGPDVPVFVQNGAADLGVVGSDILEEDGPDVYDLKALGFGACRLSLAAPAGWRADPGMGPLRVATKYPRLAERHLGALGLVVRVIRVSSSTELAPLLGLCDVIVDISWIPGARSRRTDWRRPASSVPWRPTSSPADAPTGSCRTGGGRG